MVTLNTSNSKSMNNAYAVAFHQGAYEQINTAGASALGIDNKILYDYHSTIIALNDAVLGTQGSDKTALISELDSERDRLFRFCRNTMANLKLHTDDKLRALSETAEAKILRVYGYKITRESNHEETAHIFGFVTDMRKYFGTQLAALGLDKAITNLETANQAFQTAFLERNEELAQVTPGITALLREKAEELYDRMRIVIAFHANNESDTSEEETSRCDACKDFAKVHNEYIDSIKQSIALGKSLSKSGGNSDSTNTNTKPSGGNSTNGGGSSSGGGKVDL